MGLATFGAAERPTGSARSGTAQRGRAPSLQLGTGSMHGCAADGHRDWPAARELAPRTLTRGGVEWGPVVRTSGPKTHADREFRDRALHAHAPADSEGS